MFQNKIQFLLVKFAGSGLKCSETEFRLIISSGIRREVFEKSK